MTAAVRPEMRADLRELLTLAWPVVLARVGIMTMGLTDAIVVGQYAARELALHSLAWAPSSVFVTTAVGLLMGTQVMTARLIGQGRREEAGAVFRRGLVYSVQLGLISALALILAGPWALVRVGLEDGLGQDAAAPLMVLALSLPFYLISVAAQLFLEALSRPRPGMWAMWIANGLNLLMNLWLVPGTSGLPVDGAVAACWATFAARLMLVVFLLVYIARMTDARALGVFRKPRRDRVIEREQYKVGVGAGASYFIEVSAFAAMSIVAGWLGGLEVAAWAIVLNLSAIVFMNPMGLSAATGVLVSRAYGAHDRAGLIRAGVLGLGVTGLLALAIALVVWPGAEVIIGVYTTDAALVAIAVPALILATLFFVADGIQVVAAQALRSAGDVWWPTAMHVFSYGAVMMPLAWLFAHPMGMGVDGIVWGVIVASLISAALLTGRFVRVARRMPA
ncbi:MATE family efflux transporter [Brevundimonas sp.]|uniref:MATE family efflux transporter n=1 Tax=Brevundimonas sp. TaxID=1871086 RepID=UPI001DB89486|nr:MATE family efflux transporter [Brevundimonas sp.]MBA4001299.1 MATE family efflux transporter [Brevundimonas sp.]